MWQINCYVKYVPFKDEVISINITNEAFLMTLI